MKKILFIQHGLGYGGATKSLLLLQKQLFKEYKLYTISQPVSKKTKSIIKDFEKYSEFAELDFPSIYSYSADTISEDLFREAKLFYPKEIIEFINNHYIDIVHINSTLFSHLLKPIKEHTKAKIIVHLREMVPNQDSEISQFIVNNHTKFSDSIIAISDNEIQFYPKSQKITVIPNPHEFDITDKLEEREINNEIIIGMCANFLEFKGHLDFLEMASIVEKKCKMKNVKFKIIGYPKNSFKEIIKKVIKRGYKQKFDQKVRKLKIKNLEIINYTFDIYGEIFSWDIYIRPDYTGHPWGRDIIEAMAMKKPIVATGLSEFFIENGKTGFLVPPKNPQVMAEKVIELIKNEEMRKEFGERGYKKIKEKCDIDGYGKRIAEIYEELISE